MGRRALRKIDPALDLSRHLLSQEDSPAPLDFAPWFVRRAPLEIEIGSGKGLFLETASRQFPAHNFLGIEVVRKYAHFAAARLAKAECENALVIHGDALRLFSELGAASAVAMHVYFPDPWWKKRHRKRRVMNEPLLKDVERVLVPGGKLHFWTDVEEYFHSTLDLIATATNLDGPHQVAEQEAQHDLDYRTHFERRKRQQDLPVYRALFNKLDSR